MPRISIFNMVVGFIFIFLAASAGFFLSTEHVRAHVEGGAELTSWWLQLASSAHGHTNLFGVLHILIGLTLPYGFKSQKFRIAVTLGVFLGGIAMSFLMYARSLGAPTLEYDALGILIGLFLSATLISIALHILSLLSKLKRSAVM